MVYEYVKAQGRVAFFRDGEFSHQQFRSHWAYRDPEGYIAQLERWDREAAEERAQVRAARVAAAQDYLAKRAARAAAQLVMEF